MRRPEAGIIALAMLASACAIPTEMPNWDVQWNLPVNAKPSIDITKIPLPAGITIDSVGSTRTGFTIESSVTPIDRPLGIQCPTCPSATAQKPGFTAPPATTLVNLTAGSNLQSATLVTGSQLALQVQNNFGFDPLNPPGGAPGTITLAIDNGGPTLGTLTLTGPGTTLPPGSSKQFVIDMAGRTITSAAPITIVMTMDSPAGSAAQPVTMNPNQTFVVTPTATLKVASATVQIAANALAPSTSDFDLSGLSDMAQRVEDTATDQGAMLLTVINPFTLGANATLSFSGTKTVQTDDGQSTSRPMTTIVKNVVLPAGGTGSTATVTVPFTGQELREMLGSQMTATFGGSTVAGTTLVDPAMQISTTTRMRLRVFVKEIK